MLEPWIYLNNAMSNDLVAVWDIPLTDGIHTVELEHGTLTGKRVIRVDGKEILRREWMFKLVGDETFTINKVVCLVKIEPCGLFNYSYTLIVDGKPLHTFTENRSKICSTWLVCLPPDGIYRVVLRMYEWLLAKNSKNSAKSEKKDTLDVWANGVQVEVKSEFVDNGTEMHFMLGDYAACIKSMPSYSKKEGILYTLIVDDDIIEPEA